MMGWNTSILWSKRRFGQERDMKKEVAKGTEVTLTIEDGTTIIIENVGEYSGTVTVDKAIADTLKSTGKVKEDGESKDA
jgi:hypothetical protein